ncbi:hypothetical protein [Luteimonas aquatica]|uniref:hypothetical protein n=1 Tax=Luteimonas aquatica TaxID=450364 RepID=UPI001F5765C6|nr:hypothetical protein [Luteimonas aquatica]
MSWDPLQRDVLEALGHTLYRAAPAQAAETALPEDALLHALLRAAGRDAGAADAAALFREWGPTSRLRAAAAKRALWPRLRALRGRLPA